MNRIALGLLLSHFKSPSPRLAARLTLSAMVSMGDNCAFTSVILKAAEKQGCCVICVRVRNSLIIWHMLMQNNSMKVQVCSLISASMTH